VIVLCLLFFTFFSSTVQINGLDRAFSRQQADTTDYLAEKTDAPADFVLALDTLSRTQSDLLIVKYRSRTLFSRFSNDYYARSFAPGDYSYLSRDGLELFFDQRSYVSQLSRESLLFFVIVLLVVLAYLLIYSPHFALTVTDPIHVMRRGLEEADYNLEVKIPDRYQRDDVYQLAKQYNEKYLPLKDRTQEEGGQSVLQLDLNEVTSILPEEEDD
jgi:hypothetical protein